jgi:hypothetical protein
MFASPEAEILDDTGEHRIRGARNRDRLAARHDAFQSCRVPHVLPLGPT